MPEYRSRRCLARVGLAAWLAHDLSRDDCDCPSPPPRHLKPQRSNSAVRAGPLGASPSMPVPPITYVAITVVAAHPSVGRRCRPPALTPAAEPNDEDIMQSAA